VLAKLLLLLVLPPSAIAAGAVTGSAPYAFAYVIDAYDGLVLLLLLMVRLVLLLKDMKLFKLHKTFTSFIAGCEERGTHIAGP
jgi:hypothetical protein